MSLKGRGGDCRFLPLIPRRSGSLKFHGKKFACGSTQKIWVAKLWKSARSEPLFCLRSCASRVYLRSPQFVMSCSSALTRNLGDWTVVGSIIVAGFGTIPVGPERNFCESAVRLGVAGSGSFMGAGADECDAPQSHYDFPFCPAEALSTCHLLIVCWVGR